MIDNTLRKHSGEFGLMKNDNRPSAPCQWFFSWAPGSSLSHLCPCVASGLRWGIGWFVGCLISLRSWWFDWLVDWSVLSHSYQSAASVGSSGWEAASSPVPGCRCTWQRCHQSICWRNHHSIPKENHWCIMILLAIWNTKYFKPSKTWNENSLSRLLENGSLGQLFPLMVGEKRAEGGEPWIRF